ncbi:hypothetical protein CLAVI_000561 [Candidatus Clavichlamydia salmonicola]|uniref:hypothetical protein n=1 Tax=Candidatus Clavichlamydia salmonicola TaxID=469812 RepID=UPI0018911A4C|nr:hypothetical protein [Candidatus Clavichlamydia salmonicola]MBF5050939.1 hypothetical protein [Candidatus Clavichlamydia salmonicola]
MASPITSSANPATTVPEFSSAALSKIALCDLGIRICLICLVIIVLVTFVLAVLSIPNFIPVMSPVYCLPGWILPFIIIAILNTHKHKTAKANGFSLKKLEQHSPLQPETLGPIEPIKKNTRLIKHPRRKKAPPFHQKPLFSLPVQHSDQDSVSENNHAILAPVLSLASENSPLLTKEMLIPNSPISQRSSIDVVISLPDNPLETTLLPLIKSSSSSLQSLPELSNLSF